jgi:hypothetical protein
VCPTTPRVQIEAQFVTAFLGDAELDDEDVELSQYLTPRESLLD